jgi:DNA-binding MarR family transcriptional regulator
MMNINNERKNKISYSLLRVIVKFNEIDKKTRYYGTDMPLFSSEINMIRVIKENEGVSVTGIAEKLGVTKGAVSQIINKLNNKGLIRKETDLYNQSKLKITLTPKGEIAEINHEKVHSKIDELIENILENTTEENKVFLKEFLNCLETRIDTYDEENFK